MYTFTYIPGKYIFLQSTEGNNFCVSRTMEMESFVEWLKAKFGSLWLVLHIGNKLQEEEIAKSSKISKL